MKKRLYALMFIAALILAACVLPGLAEGDTRTVTLSLSTDSVLINQLITAQVNAPGASGATLYAGRGGQPYWFMVDLNGPTDFSLWEPGTYDVYVTASYEDGTSADSEHCTVICTAAEGAYPGETGITVLQSGEGQDLVFSVAPLVTGGRIGVTVSRKVGSSAYSDIGYWDEYLEQYTVSADELSRGWVVICASYVPYGYAGIKCEKLVFIGELDDTLTFRVDETEPLTYADVTAEANAPDASAIEIWGRDEGSEEFYAQYTGMNELRAILSYGDTGTREYYAVAYFGEETRQSQTITVTPQAPYGEMPPADIDAPARLSSGEDMTFTVTVPEGVNFSVDVYRRDDHTGYLSQTGVTTGTWTLTGPADGAYGIRASAVTPGYIGNGLYEAVVVVGECGHGSTSWKTPEETCTFTEKNDAYHLAVYDWIDIRECDYCGEELEREPHHSEYDSTHTYDDALVCTLCGHVNQCAHENMTHEREVLSLESCTDNGDGTHTVVGTVYEYDLCPDCLMKFDEQTHEHGRFVQDHQWENGICERCEAACTHPRGFRETQTQVNPRYTELPGSNLYHRTVYDVVPVFICDICGLWDIHTDDIIGQSCWREVHCFNDEGVCYQCGAARTDEINKSVTLTLDRDTALTNQPITAEVTAPDAGGASLYVGRDDRYDEYGLYLDRPTPFRLYEAGTYDVYMTARFDDGTTVDSEHLTVICTEAEGRYPGEMSLTVVQSGEGQDLVFTVEPLVTEGDLRVTVMQRDQNNDYADVAGWNEYLEQYTVPASRLGKGWVRLYAAYSPYGYNNGTYTKDLYIGQMDDTLTFTISQTQPLTHDTVYLEAAAPDALRMEIWVKEGSDEFYQWDGGTTSIETTTFYSDTEARQYYALAFFGEETKQSDIITVQPQAPYGEMPPVGIDAPARLSSGEALAFSVTVPEGVRYDVSVTRRDDGTEFLREHGVTAGNYNLTNLEDGAYEISAYAAMRGYAGNGAGSVIVVIGECGHGSSFPKSWEENRSFTPVDDMYHHTTSDRICAEICEYCGEELERDTEHCDYGNERHTYDDAGVCGLCGHVDQCAHEDICHEREIIDLKECADNGDGTHTVTADYSEYDICSYCGMRFDVQTFENGQFTEAHQWSGGTCWRCGKVCDHPNGLSETTDNRNFTATPIEGSTLYHMWEYDLIRVERCDICGLWLPHEDEIVGHGADRIYHEFDEEGHCRCGAVRSDQINRTAELRLSGDHVLTNQPIIAEVTAPDAYDASLIITGTDDQNTYSLDLYEPTTFRLEEAGTFDICMRVWFEDGTTAESAHHTVVCADAGGEYPGQTGVTILASGLGRDLVFTVEPLTVPGEMTVSVLVYGQDGRIDTVASWESYQDQYTVPAGKLDRGWVFVRAFYQPYGYQSIDAGDRLFLGQIDYTVSISANDSEPLTNTDIVLTATAPDATRIEIWKKDVDADAAFICLTDMGTNTSEINHSCWNTSERQFYAVAWFGNESRQSQIITVTPRAPYGEMPPADIDVPERLSSGEDLTFTVTMPEGAEYDVYVDRIDNGGDQVFCQTGVTTGTYTLTGLEDGAYSISAHATMPGYIGDGHNMIVTVIGLCGHRETETRYVRENEVYEAIDDAVHEHVFDEYTAVVCRYCGEELERTLYGHYETEEYHNYDENGVCALCRHVNGCAHVDMAHRLEILDHSACVDNGDGTHTVTGWIREYDTCPDCHVRLNMTETPDGEVVEDHRWYEGSCEWCSAACVHPEGLVESRDTRNHVLRQIEGSSLYHMDEYDVIRAEYCEICDLWIEHEDEIIEHRAIRERHGFDDQGHCLCGAVQSDEIDYTISMTPDKETVLLGEPVGVYVTAPDAEHVVLYAEFEYGNLTWNVDPMSGGTFSLDTEGTFDVYAVAYFVDGTETVSEHHTVVCAAAGGEYPGETGITILQSGEGQDLVFTIEPLVTAGGYRIIVSVPDQGGGDSPVALWDAYQDQYVVPSAKLGRGWVFVTVQYSPYGYSGITEREKVFLGQIDYTVTVTASEYEPLTNTHVEITASAPDADRVEIWERGDGEGGWRYGYDMDGTTCEYGKCYTSGRIVYQYYAVAHFGEETRQSEVITVSPQAPNGPCEQYVIDTPRVIGSGEDLVFTVTGMEGLDFAGAVTNVYEGTAVDTFSGTSEGTYTVSGLEDGLYQIHAKTTLAGYEGDGWKEVSVYVGTCDHEETETYTSRDINSVETEGDDRWHEETTLYYEIVVCSECGQELSRILTDETTSAQKHHYQDGVCVDCGHVNTCVHEDQEWEHQACMIDETCAPYDHDRHVITGTLYQYDECTGCFTRFNETWTPDVSEFGEHSFVDDVCWKCDYVCVHPEEERVSVRVFVNMTVDDIGSAKYHRRNMNYAQGEGCEHCGMIVERGHDITETVAYFEEHEFDENMICTVCDHNGDHPIDKTLTLTPVAVSVKTGEEYAFTITALDADYIEIWVTEQGYTYHRSGYSMGGIYTYKAQSGTARALVYTVKAYYDDECVESGPLTVTVTAPYGQLPDPVIHAESRGLHEGDLTISVTFPEAAEHKEAYVYGGVFRDFDGGDFVLTIPEEELTGGGYTIEAYASAVGYEPSEAYKTIYLYDHTIDDGHTHIRSCREDACRLCGATEADGVVFDVIHDWKSDPEFDAVSHWTECRDCGERITSEHHFNDAGVCEECGFDSSSALITYDWAEDHSAVTATCTMMIGDEPDVITETVAATAQITREATCMDAGETTYTSGPFTHDCFTVQTMVLEDIPALGHAWGEAAYTWAEDLSAVTARRVCGHDAEHVETETVTVTETVTLEPTCTSDGTKDLTAVFTYPAFETQTRTGVAIPAIGHDWSEPTYTWAEDCSTVTATRICGRDTEHIETETVDAVETVNLEPTCTEDGLKDLTAVFTNTAFETQYKTGVVIPALGHDLKHHEAKAPTCTEPGWDEYFTCSRCDYTTYAELAALGHDLERHEAKAPTCTEPGWDEYFTCSRCDHTTYAELAALGHDLERHEAKAPTCTEPGWDEYFTCSRCDYTTYEELAALGHDLEHHEAKAPTCTEPGWDEYDACSRCDYTTYTELAALGHDMRHFEAKEPTCTEAGWHEYDACAREGCDNTTYEEIPALGHDLEHHEGRAPTCTESGWDEYDTCSRCDHTTYAEQAALGHDLERHEAKAPTCLEPGWDEYFTCSRCDYTTYAELAALGHDIRHFEAKEPTCTEVGWNEYDACVHEGCDNTTYEEIPALGHDLEHHEGKVPTCTEPGWDEYDTCSRCDYTTFAEKAALGHAWSDVTYTWAEGNSAVTAARTCANDPTHTETEEVRATSAVTKAPTCEEKGETTWTTDAFTNPAFSVQKKTEANIPATGHTEATLAAKAPTCTETGLTEGKKCSVCGKILTPQQTVPAKGHTVVIDPAVEPTYTATGLTEGSHCSVCGTVLVKQQVVPVKEEPTVANVDAATFPDAAFRDYVSRNIDTNGDGRLTASEIAPVRAIDLSGLGSVRNMAGIGVFTDLTSLNVSGNQLTGLDLSGNTKLTGLTCTGNVYTMNVKAGICDLSGLTGFDVSRASSFSDGTLSGTTLTVLKPGSVTYTYDCGMGFKATFTLKITADRVAIGKVTPKKTSYAYTGKEIEPTLTVTAEVSDGNEAAREVTLKNSQYKAVFSDNLKAGTATVKVTGTGFFKGTVTVKFKITPVKLNSAELKYVKKAYTGKALKPTATVKAKVGGKSVTLKSGTDYSVTYKNNTNAGTATVTIKGKGNFTGTLTKTFTITKVKVGEVKFNNPSLPYNGKAKKPAMTVRATVNGKKIQLTQDRDFTITYKDNKNVGTATVTVKGKGNYTGTVTANFKINPLKLSTATVTLSKTTMTYTGKALKPTVTVKMKVGSSTVTLVKGTDYTVSYKNNVEAGTATVTIKGKGNFTGTATVTFEIVTK